MLWQPREGTHDINYINSHNHPEPTSSYGVEERHCWISLTRIYWMIKCCQTSRDGELSNMYSKFFLAWLVSRKGCCCQLKFHTQESTQVSVERMMNSACNVCTQGCCGHPGKTVLASLSLNASLRSHLERKLIRTKGCIWYVSLPAPDHDRKSDTFFHWEDFRNDPWPSWGRGYQW